MSWAKSRHPPSVIPTSLLQKSPAGELEMLACLTPSLGSLAASSASPARALWLAFDLARHRDWPPPRLILLSELCRCGCLQT